MQFHKHHLFQSHSAAVYALTAGNDSSHFYSGSGDHFIAEWNLNTLEQEKFAVNIGEAVYSLLYIPDGHLLIAGTGSGAFHVIDRIEKKELRLIAFHTKGIYDLQYDHHQKKMLVAGGDGVLSVWSVPEFELIRSIPLCEEKLRQIAMHPSGDSYAIACGDGNVRILESTFLNETTTIKAHEGGSTSVAWHPTKQVLVSGGKDAHLKCWNRNNNYACIVEIPAHNYAIYAIAFHPQLAILATASRDKTIKIWDAASFDVLQRMDAKSGGHSHSVNKVIWIGDQLVSCGDDRQIIIWETE